jgi:hypothetical protein
MTLVLTLVILTVFGLIAAAVAGFAFTAFRNTTVVQERIERVAAVDAGLRFVMQRVADDGTVCVDGREVPSQEVNGYTVELDCGYEIDSRAGRIAWALVVSDDNNDAFTLSQGGDKIVSGPIWLASLDSPGNNKTLYVRDGFVASGDCSLGDTPPAWIEWEYADRTKAPADFRCYPGKTWQDVYDPAPGLPASSIFPPAITPLTIAPLNADAAATKCAVFGPGKYDFDGVFDLAPWDEVFFQSGVYYFEDTVINISKTFVKAGTSSGSGLIIGKDKQVPRMPICADQEAADPGRGVTWILGGGSRIVIQGNNDSSLELFKRVGSQIGQPGDPEIENQNVSLIAVSATSAASDPGYQESSLTSGADCKEETDVSKDAGIIVADGGENTKFATDGLVYAPQQRVCLFVTSKAAFQSSGGIVVAGIDVGSTPSGDGLVISGGTSSVPSQLIINAKAVGKDGRPGLPGRAIVDVGTYRLDSGTVRRLLEVKSWRIG